VHPRALPCGVEPLVLILGNYLMGELDLILCRFLNSKSEK
jgi:hypothetical protein